MSLFTIADLHLSFGVKKPMDIFSGWDKHIERLTENWKTVVKPEDTVVVGGDISWGMNFREARQDFAYLDSLPGQKILLKGNHDYYFSTKRKIDNFFTENGFTTLHFLFNNSYDYEDFSICGTRGWINEPGEPADKKVLLREAGRLELSLQSAKKKPIVFLHYPPLYIDNRSEYLLDVLKKHEVYRVFYGHLHGKSCKAAVQGTIDGITYRLVSADYLQFCPLKVL